MIITILPYHWGLLSFSEGHLQGCSFPWLFGRAEPLFNSSGSSPLSRSTYWEWRVEFRERSGSIRGGRVRWAEVWCPALDSGLLSESYQIHSCSIGGWAVLALSSWTPGLENPPRLSALVSSTPPLNRGLLVCLASFSFCSKQAAGTLLVGEGESFSRKARAKPVSDCIMFSAHLPC